MVVFPNCKINLGLHILRRRKDGYHDIETVMVPVPWCDVLEIVPSQGEKSTLTVTGRKVDCEPEKNLVMKAYRAVKELFPSIPEVDIYLRKIIPDGAGMGGGSSDAAFTIKALNEMFKLGLNDEKMAQIAGKIGADCPFFVYNRPMLCEDTGVKMRETNVNLKGDFLAIKKPEKSVSTKDAYSRVTPHEGRTTIEEIIGKGKRIWQNELRNDFEESVFPQVPEAEKIKREFLKAGAYYAGMSGSGSAVYGLFEDEGKASSVEGAKVFKM